MTEQTETGQTEQTKTKKEPSPTKRLAQRIEKRLMTIGVPSRKAGTWAPILAKAFTRTQKRMATGMADVTSRAVAATLTGRLMKYGLTERKATGIATKLTPTVKTALKASVVVSTALAVREDLAPLVGKGLQLRLDQDVVPYQGARGLKLLRVMHGLTSTASYLVVAVKGEEGIVAVRKFSDTSFKIKFYPTFAFWGRSLEDLERLGGRSYLNRGPYERVMVTDETLSVILTQLTLQARVKARIKALASRFLAIPFAPVKKAFGYLDQWHRQRYGRVA